MNTTQLAKTGATRLAQWKPFALVESLQDEMERFLWPLGFGGPALRDRLLRGTRTSQTAIYEQGSDLVVSSELPGVLKDEISVTLQRGELVIQGETKAAAEQETDYFRRERHYRSYYRRVQLPFEVQPGQVMATYTDGVLEVRIPNPDGPAAAKQNIPVQ